MPAEISGGMRKRVGIARAIVMNPKYLFCDEPNSGLDPMTSIKIDELISDITDEFNMTTIVVTHDMNSVMGIGEYVMFLHEGLKEWDGDSNSILHSKSQALREFVFASKIMEKLL
jgi:phospholipid/cholesterol/gamma-HCH transport system ATP-binding protein